ncbi:glycerophosphoryl diester phosphodiesterase [Anopheles sinensis]|uniref:Glycerophosphoryl diester phosphodiesterase n=1 Tax=Anopheles sinensis TaxID=74873 RepID=A0A084VGY8_ANOSI|nr:glycerophosphoryl diester phosphodiesterase [Anopheles sinensis]
MSLWCLVPGFWLAPIVTLSLPTATEGKRNGRGAVWKELEAMLWRGALVEGAGMCFNNTSTAGISSHPIQQGGWGREPSDIMMLGREQNPFPQQWDGMLGA